MENNFLRTIYFFSFLFLSLAQMLKTVVDFFCPVASLPNLRPYRFSTIHCFFQLFFSHLLLRIRADADLFFHASPDISHQVDHGFKNLVICAVYEADKYRQRGKIVLIKWRKRAHLSNLQMTFSSVKHLHSLTKTTICLVTQLRRWSTNIFSAVFFSVPSSFLLSPKFCVCFLVQRLQSWHAKL